MANGSNIRRPVKLQKRQQAWESLRGDGFKKRGREGYKRPGSYK